MNDIPINLNFRPPFNTQFIVENVTNPAKDIIIFDFPIRIGEVRNLMDIPYISEIDIKQSLLKGELLNRLNAGDIRVISSNLNLEQYSNQFETFLRNNNIQLGGIANSLANFTFRPGAPPNGPVFNDFEKLYNVLQNSPGEKLLVFDDTFAPCVIPNIGVPYDFRDVTFSGTLSDNDGTLVSIEDGVVINNLFIVRNSLFLLNESNTTPIELGEDAFILFERGSGIASSTAAPLIQVADGATNVTLVLNLAGSVRNFNGNPAVNVGQNAELNISAFDLAEVESGTIDGDGYAQFIAGSPSANLILPQPVTNLLQFTGSFASNILYFPANLADWDNNFPANLNEALDRIAALIGPIP